MNIIHFSDIHFEINKEGSLSYEKEQLYNALVNDLQQYVDSDSIMVITGDLINKGGKDFNKENPFEKFKELFIKKITNNFPSLRTRIFIVPGNHDITKDEIDDIMHKGIIETYKENYDNGDNFIKDNENNYEKLKHLELYKNFEKDFYKNYNNVKITNFQTTAIVGMNSLNLGIACFNSAWLCSKKGQDDHGNLILGKNQIEQALKDIKDTNFKIALFHHPIEFFMEKDREYIEPLLFNNFNVILNGHSHKIESGYYQTLKGSVFISVSPAVLGTRETDARFPTGYTVIKFDKDKYIVYHRKYLWDSNKFVPNVNIGDNKGEKTFIISAEQQEIKNTISKALTHIENTHIDETNSDLIIYNAEEGLPNSIEDVFINPTICNVTEPQAQNGKTGKGIKYYSLEKIILSDENFLIYGKKEAGKTILLDDFLIELTKNPEKYKKLPVLIKFQDIKNKDIETCIKQFLSLSTRTEFKNLYNNSETRFTLLVDDLFFSDIQKHKLSKLIEFKKIYPNVQIIATSLHKIDNMIPEDHLEYNKYFNFNVVYIHDLKTLQIKNLIKKWFGNKDVDFQSNIKRLIKNFRDLGLPRNPLSLTMFLWIIQKQEKRPINRAVLAEIFIENLLEKANFENVYAGTFDFYNKKRLLAFLSLYMLKNGDPQNSYSIQYSRTLDYIKKYLKGKTGDPKIILDNFIDRGIFVLIDGTIRFKFAFYFHFFLAAYMEFEGSFKNEVLENIIEYKDELEYYTGLNRDKEEILNVVLKELMSTYQELNKFIFESPEKNMVDKILETKKPLSNYIDLGKIKKPSDKDLEKAYDDNLQYLPVNRKVEPKQLMSDKGKKYRLAKMLELSAHLLKNLEEIKFDTKVCAYKEILKSSISFLLLYRDYLLENYDKLKDSSFFPKGINLYVFISLLPLLHQVVLYDWLGTIKLKEIIEDKIKKDDENNNISEFEKFLSVFIYSDIKGPDYFKRVKNFCKNSKSKYILDSIFFKLLSYYSLRSKDKETDKFYLNILSDIKIKLGQIDKAGKSQFINKLVENKRSHRAGKNEQDDKI